MVMSTILLDEYDHEVDDDDDSFCDSNNNNNGCNNT